MRANTRPSCRVDPSRPREGHLNRKRPRERTRIEAASQVDQALDELEGGHRQGGGSQGQGDEAVAEAQAGRQDFDLALEVLAAPDLQGHKKRVGQGLQPHPGAEHKHDALEGQGVVLPLHEAQYPHERQDQQDPFEEGHLGQGGVRVPVLLAQEGHQGQVEAEFRHQQEDARPNPRPA